MVDLHPLEAFPLTMKPKTKRLLFILGGVITAGFICTILLSLLSESLIFFYTPSDLAHKHISYGQHIRVGGVVVPHSLLKHKDKISFKLTDTKANIEVQYKGTLPELFREGQEIVAEGEFQGPSLLEARSILAKHDETYRPKTAEEQSYSSNRSPK